MSTTSPEPGTVTEQILAIMNKWSDGDIDYKSNVLVTEYREQLVSELAQLCKSMGDRREVEGRIDELVRPWGNENDFLLARRSGLTNDYENNRYDTLADRLAQLQSEVSQQAEQPGDKAEPANFLDIPEEQQVKLLGDAAAAANRKQRAIMDLPAPTEGQCPECSGDPAYIKFGHGCLTCGGSGRIQGQGASK